MQPYTIEIGQHVIALSLGLQVLANFLRGVKLLAEAKDAPTSPGLELLLNAGAEAEGQTAPLQPTPNLATPGSQYVRKEADAAWDLMQAESKRLLAELLHAPLLKSSNLRSALQTGAQLLC